MSEKSLKDKTVKVKGGTDYAMVKDRILWLDQNKNGAYSIDTNYTYYPDQRLWVVKAVLTVDEQTYSGLAQEVESDDYRQVNSTSALENCETSAIGRACSAYGIGIQESYASSDEVVKAMNRKASATGFVTAKQVELLINKVKWGLKTYDPDEILNFLSQTLGKEVNQLKKEEMDEAILKVDQAVKADKTYKLASKDDVIRVGELETQVY